MKICKIRDLSGHKVDLTVAERVVREIKLRFDKAGFISDAEVTGPTSFKAGLRMCSFRIDSVKRGYNADTSQYAIKSCKKGWKRTCIPTWQEREEYNHIINDVLDKFKLRANAKNSLLSIRYYETGRVNNWDMSRFGRGERAYYEICKVSELSK